MNKFSLILFTLIIFTLPLFSQTQHEFTQTEEDANSISQANTEIVTENTNKTEDKKDLEDPTRPFLVFPKLNLLFDQGISYCQLTRIEKQAERSNFVRENLMAGAYFNVEQGAVV